MSLGQLNNSTCLRATLRQDIPVEHRAVLPQRGLSPGERQGSLLPWGYAPLSFWHEHPIYRNFRFKQEQAYSTARQHWHVLLSAFTLMLLSSFQYFVKNMTC